MSVISIQHNHTPPINPPKAKSRYLHRSRFQLIFIRQWRIILEGLKVVIVETPTFTRRIQSLMSDDEYRSLQLHLLQNPEIGKLIRGSGGLRKLRWNIPGKGKQKGSRIIYFWAHENRIILLLMVFQKSDRTDLTFQQLRTLRQIVEEEFK